MQNAVIKSWGASMIQNIYVATFGALIVIAAFTPIAIVIIDKTGL